MPKVLLVDDSAVDLLFARKVLEEDDDLQVVCAHDGRQALEQIGRETPDIVVSDMVMPEMDGLELVREVRAKFPFLPVVIMTSRGSEEVAVRALEHGAASYVPKGVLAVGLRETIESVLAVSGQRRQRAELMRGMVESSCTFEIGSDRALLRPLVHYVQEQISAFEICDEAERMRVGVAVEEALNNAAEHGNLELQSELRESDFDGYFRLARERTGQAPYKDRRIRVDMRFSIAEAEIRIEDQGSGFDVASLPDPRDPANVEATSGRGILLMRLFMDEVVFNDVGNQVRMVKRRAPFAAGVVDPRSTAADDEPV